MFLTASDIARLTGYKHKAKQCEQLRKMGIRFDINALGEPIVSENYYMGKTDKPAANWQPAILRA